MMRVTRPYTCEDVPAYVAVYGKVASLLWAKLNGATSIQISAGRRCLGLGLVNERLTIP
jgi:hypothetical protein